MAVTSRRALIVSVALSALACGCGAEHGDAADAAYGRAVDALRRGELEPASDAAARAAAVLSSTPEAPAALQARLLQAEIALAQGQPDAATTFAGAAVPAALRDHDVAARHAKVLGQIDLVRRRLPDAAGKLAVAEMRARALGNGELLREVLLLDGLRLLASGDPGAWQRTEEAYENARAAGDRYWMAPALNNLGLIRFAAFRYDEALALFQQALDGARAIGARRFAAASLTNIGPSYYRLGDFARARDALEQAARIQEAIGARGHLQASLGELGNLAFLENDAPTAAKLYRRAAALARVHSPRDAPRWEGNLAAVLAHTGAWDEADELNRQAIAAREAVHDRSGIAYARLNAGIIALGRGQIADAERLLRESAATAGDNGDLAWETSAELAAVAAAKGDHAGATRHFEAALAGVERTRAGLQTDHQIAFLQPRLRFYRRYVEWLVDHGQTDRALAVAESSRLQLLASRVRRGAGVGRRPQLNDFQRLAARERAALVSYWIAPRRSFAWVITARSRQLVELPGAAEISRLVQAYRTFLDASVRDPLTERFAPAEELYSRVVAPIVVHLGQMTRVVVSPDGPLHAVPLDALIVPGARPRYWIEDVTIEIAPSLGVLTAEESGQPRGSGMLAFGSPESSIGGLPRLVHARDELAALAAGRTDVTVIAGRSATPEAFRAAVPHRFARIHFAAHAIANAVSPLDSAIVVEPGALGGRLLARDLLNERFTADLVTISACRGAGARTVVGEGLVGFAWVLLHAGARQVVAGLWDVNDRSTSELMNAFYRALDGGERPGEALRAAKLRLRADGSSFRHPYYWAAFQAFIGPGPSSQSMKR